jgi:hypothetical protein
VFADLLCRSLGLVELERRRNRREPDHPRSRTIPNTEKRYNIDIREFLTTTDNAVVREKLSEFVGELPAADQARFRSRSRGSFDFRAD